MLRFGAVSQRRRTLAGGFSLVELLTVLAIVAILATVAYPSYRAPVRRSHRVAAEALLMQMSLRQQQRMLDVRAYADSLETLGVALPDEVASHYRIEITTEESTTAGFSITATPVGGQVGDPCAALSIDHRGAKMPAGCW